ncbi:TetR/AcrR family transcriptional regulator [bacterium]|nr:TetR/AcrR family transcriptional regulator [bacterium]
MNKFDYLYYPFEQTDETLPRREREKETHRLEILAAATRVFARKGYFHATLDEVAQEAEFSKASLYNYFSSKEDLLFSIMKTVIFSRNSAFSVAFSGKKPFTEELVDFLVGAAKFAFSNPDLVKVLEIQRSMGFIGLSDEKGKELHVIINQGNRWMMDRFTRAISDKQLKEYPPDALLEAIFVALNGLFSICSYKCKNSKDIEKVSRIFADILLNGIAAREEVVSDR